MPAPLAAFLYLALPRNIDPKETLRYFSWAIFIGACLIYSAFVFSGELSKDGPLFFSKRNERTTSQVLGLHSAFLIALFCLMQVSALIVPTLPFRLTDTSAARGARFSLADVGFVLIAAVLVYFERRWLFIDSNTRGKEQGHHPTQDTPKDHRYTQPR